MATKAIRGDWLIWLMGGALALAATAESRATEALALAGGFEVDPQRIDATAVGALSAADWVRGCPGFVAEAPSMTLDFSTPVYPLALIAEGAAALLVEDPSGVFTCAPAGRTRAVARFATPQAGVWRLWPATAEQGAEAAVTLLVTERDPAEVGVAGPALAHGAPPAFGALATPAEGTAEASLVLSGGVEAAAAAGSACAGFVDPARPDAVVAHDGGALALRVVSGADATLVVRAPSGAIHCDDDSVGADPALFLDPAEPGDWAIWVGVFGGEGGAPATLRVGRTPDGGPVGAAQGAVALDAAASPAAGAHALDPAGSLSLALSLTGDAQASEAIAGCGGTLEPSRPDAVIRLDAPAPRLALRARSGGDATLVVIDPNGAAHCNDDAYGLDPALTIDGAPAGDYAVWVGYWGEPGAATLLAALDPEALATAEESFGAAFENPFAGLTITSAAQALAILTAAPEVSSVLAYERLEEEGREGFTLHGVTLTDPSGETPPTRVERLRVAALDLAGLSGAGPDRFDVSFEGVDYTSLAGGAQAFGGPQAPALDGRPTMSMRASFLPPEDGAAARDARLGVTLDGQFAFAMGGRFAWPAGATLGPDLGALPVSGFVMEFRDSGYLALALADLARQLGLERDALAAIVRAQVEAAFSSAAPESPDGRMRTAALQMLDGLDRPGLAILRLAAEAPQGLDALFEAQDARQDQFSVDFAYAPRD